MVNATDVISASDYNNLRSTVSAILDGSWNQTMLSSTVIGYQQVALFADSVLAENVKNLLLDMQKVHVHQNGTLSTNIIEPLVGYKIGADEAKTFDVVTGDSQSTADGLKMGYNDFLSVVTNLADHDPATDGFPDENFSIGSTTVSNRSTSWGGTGSVESIYHIFEVSFPDFATIRSFFNAGGFIQVGSTITNVTNSKDVEWQSVITSMGPARFYKWDTVAASGTGLAGYQDLTSTYQEVFRKTGSGVYVDQVYTLEALEDQATNTIRFRATYTDGYTGVGDIDVSANISHQVQAYYPDSSFTYDSVDYTAVLIDGPSITDITGLNENFTTPPS